MGRNKGPCPNCGGGMEIQPEVQQSTEGRTVTLQWATCCSCRHVRLEHWTLVARLHPDQEGESLHQTVRKHLAM